MTTTLTKPLADANVQAVLSAHQPLRRPSALAASLTFGWRALLKIKHVPFQLFDVTMFPIMMTLMFTFLFGGALAGSVDAYVQVLIPGILVMTVSMIGSRVKFTENSKFKVFWSSCSHSFEAMYSSRSTTR
mgnify:CR=1 FL=1